MLLQYLVTKNIAGQISSVAYPCFLEKMLIKEPTFKNWVLDTTAIFNEQFATFIPFVPYCTAQQAH